MTPYQHPNTPEQALRRIAQLDADEVPVHDWETMWQIATDALALLPIPTEEAERPTPEGTGRTTEGGDAR